MAKVLERDLGLVALITISVGAMTGPGLFVLPGIAAGMAGPAVVAAYVLAGLLALPAALSMAELATAMPGSGGPYLYLDRALGPAAGTVAGVGSWLSLLFKGAFALIGLGAYLALVTDLDPGTLKLVAVSTAALLTLVNVLGVKETGNLQITIVVGVLAALVAFVVLVAPSADPAAFSDPLPQGGLGLLAATGFVFVSFIGIMKVASIAEEVEDPERNLPRGILISLAIVLVLYPILTFTFVGVVPLDAAAHSITPIGDAALTAGGTALTLLVTVAAVAALASMANAALLAASRFPFALSRDRLAPPGLQRVSDRFGTPVVAILTSGGLLVALVAAFPVELLAEFASAFLLLIFGFMNLAVVVLRQGSPDAYQPSFRAPGYPWVHAFGVVGSTMLLALMGTLPLLGVGGILVGSVLFYQLYGRPRTTREGVGVDVMRRAATRSRVEATRRVLSETSSHPILVPVRSGISPEREALLLRIAADIARERQGTVHVMRFDEVPDQMDLEHAASLHTAEDAAFEAQTSGLSQALEVPVEIGEVVSHDVKRAVVNYVKRHGIEAVIADAEMGPDDARLFGRDLDRLLKRVPCDVVLVKMNRGLGSIREVAVTSARGPFDPIKVRIANALAMESGATVKLVHSVELDTTDAQLSAIRAYHDELAALCTVPTRSVVLREGDWLEGLLRSVKDTDAVIVGASARSRFGSETSTRIAELAAPTTLIVRPAESRPRSFVRRTIERWLY